MRDEVSNESTQVLLVEDSPEDAELIMRSLVRGDMNLRVHHVEDGASALAFLRGEGEYADRVDEPPPKVVLLDLKLPKKNGLEVLAEVRKDPRTRLTPVVVLTSSREDQDLVTAYDLGANSYIVKPIDYAEFKDVTQLVARFWIRWNEAIPKP